MIFYDGAELIRLREMADNVERRSDTDPAGRDRRRMLHDLIGCARQRARGLHAVIRQRRFEVAYRLLVTIQIQKRQDLRCGHVGIRRRGRSADSATLNAAV